jgi:DNA repair protein RadC
VVKTLAPNDRPREKLLRSGVETLGDNELVALVLGTGVRARSALTVAQDILERAGGVRGLARARAEDLSRVSGVGGPRAARLLAAVELGRRAVRSDVGERPRLLSARAIADYLMPIYAAHREERVGIVMLDAKRRVIRTEVLTVGTLDSSLAHPREVFRAATLASASSIAIFHNHPSGDPRPSPDDVLLTQQLVAAGEVVGIPVVDHLILGDGCWFSFQEAGAW